MPDALLQLVSIDKNYGHDHTMLPVLSHVNLDLHAGEMVALMAPSGSGKSTLLHIAGLLDQPSKGDVVIDGTATKHLSATQQAHLRAQHLGFVYQFHNLLPEFTSLENIILPQLIIKTPLKQAQEHATALLKLLGLEGRAHHLPNQLSGGEQQRVAIARALANKPKILFADEPTGNLDTQTGDLVFQELIAIVKERGLCCFVATHNEQLASRMDKVLTIKDKQLVPHSRFSSNH